jgi:hypothetical protein
MTVRLDMAWQYPISVTEQRIENAYALFGSAPSHQESQHPTCWIILIWGLAAKMQ